MTLAPFCIRSYSYFSRLLYFFPHSSQHRSKSIFTYHSMIVICSKCFTTVFFLNWLTLIPYEQQRRGDNYTHHLHLWKDIYLPREKEILKKQKKKPRKSSEEEIYVHNSATTYSLWNHKYFMTKVDHSVNNKYKLWSTWSISFRFRSATTDYIDDVNRCILFPSTCYNLLIFVFLYIDHIENFLFWSIYLGILVLVISWYWWYRQLLFWSIYLVILVLAFLLSMIWTTFVLINILRYIGIDFSLYGWYRKLFVLVNILRYIGIGFSLYRWYRQLLFWLIYLGILVLVFSWYWWYR